MKNCLQQFLFLVCISNCFSIKCNFRYAEEDKNYPENIIESLVQKSFVVNDTVNDSKEFICDDDVDKGTYLLDFFTARLDETTTSKLMLLDDDLDAESLCCTSTKTIHPKALPSVKNNKLVTVINHGEFSQSVTIEECTNANKPCQFNENFPLGYVTKCKQKHQMHVIKALNREQNAIVDETVYYPSGCDCKVSSMKRVNSN